MGHLKKRIIGFGLALDVIILDQITKWLVLEWIIRPHLSGRENSSLGLFEWFSNSERLLFARIEVTSFFNFVMVWNEGISFGMFKNGMTEFLIVATTGISLLFAAWLTRATGWVQACALGLVIGGAMGNVIDRLHFGAVADFLDFHAFGWHYPAFNLADSCITIGIALLVFDGLFLEHKRNKDEA